MSSSNIAGTAVGPLSERLRARIRREGPISFRDWMQAALYDERDGYYCRSDRVRWGREGDYRTAPERSPLFAATFARYFSKLFTELGSPSSWTMVEAGAGSGDFARGVLESLAAHHPEVFVATRYLIDEIGSSNRERIAQQLTQFPEQTEFRRLDEIALPITGIIFSNELLDAFPVHRVTMRAGNPLELSVGLTSENQFVWVEKPLINERVRDYLNRADIQLSEEQIVEVNLDVEDWVASAAAKLERGYLISVDYGAERNELLNAEHRRKGTLRAFRRHRFSEDLLSDPGEQDLTTTVNWTQIKEAGKRAGLEATRLERLDQLLLAEGLLEILEEQVAKPTDESKKTRLRTSARELIMPDGMARSFQVLVQERRR
jgi:SAM-dependent MidA family methyltransferase